MINHNRFRWIAIVTLGLPVLAPAFARAELLGSTATVERIFDGTVFYNHSATVNDTVEFFNIVSEANIKITDSQIDIDPVSSGTYGAGGFNGYVITFAGIPPITEAVLDASTNWPPASVNFTSNSVSVDYEGITVPPFSSLSSTVVDVTVPEPGSLLILGSGVFGACLRRRRGALKVARTII